MEFVGQPPWRHCSSVPSVNSLSLSFCSLVVYFVWWLLFNYPALRTLSNNRKLVHSLGMVGVSPTTLLQWLHGDVSFTASGYKGSRVSRMHADLVTWVCHVTSSGRIQSAVHSEVHVTTTWLPVASWIDDNLVYDEFISSYISAFICSGKYICKSSFSFSSQHFKGLFDTTPYLLTYCTFI